MPMTSSERKDYILRMIEQIQRLVAEMMGRVRDGGTPDELLAQARASVGELLGPLAGVAPRMDSATAGQMVGDPDVLYAWAQVVRAEAGLHHARGDASHAAVSARRALELALEAHLRTTRDRPELLALIAALRPSVDPAALAPRHGDALAGLPAAAS
jgi:hypothetical protein